MANPFLSSEEYDERAHRMYDNGDYEGALETLKEGIQLYPHSVELYVGLGYTRLAREEYAWARQDFERALVLDGEHEDALVGIGEVMLRFGRRHDALAYFEKARDTGCSDDLDLLLSMGRALYRERMFEHAREVFVEAVRVHRDSAEAWPVREEQISELRLANARGPLQHHFEDGLKLAGRAGDHFEHLGGGGLLLQGLVELARALLHVTEQTRVLGRDYRLVGKGGD